MDFVYIGDLVNTHGIKGEVRIASDFKYKDEVFKEGFKLYIGKQKEELIINSHRIHKNYDMVTFMGIDDINDVLIYKGELVYINKRDLKEYEYVSTDLIGFEVYDNDKKVGTVKEIIKNKLYNIFVITDGKKESLVPDIKEFIDNIDLDKKKIIIKHMEGLINEN